VDTHLCFRINKPKVIYETFEDEQVIINLDTGNYYSLDRVAADIWGLIEQGLTVGDVIEGMACRYAAGSRSEIETEVKKFIAILQQEALIVPAEAKTGTPVPTGVSPEAAKQAFCPPALHTYSDMQQLLILDPIHEVDETGWPAKKQESSR